ncbi:hypothetical protein EMIT079MI2_140118 [Bacillus sp. IT-79MI2]
MQFSFIIIILFTYHQTSSVTFKEKQHNHYAYVVKIFFGNNIIQDF